MASGTTRSQGDAKAPHAGSRSAEIFERAKKILVGGVDSPVRAFRAVGGTPLIIDRGQGARLWDVDGREYLDFVCSWGALILGHAHPDVVSAVADQAARGTSYGMTSPLEIDLAEQIARALPSVERIRFVSSGTEATMSAIRAARGFTKRDLILKFEGGYHGHSDSFLVEAGSGPRDAGHFLVGGRSRRVRETHFERAVQRPRHRRDHFSQARGENRGGDCRAGGGEHGRRPASRWIPSRSFARSRAARARS